MKIHAARKIGYDAEGLRRAVEYLCEQVCDRNNLPGYKIPDYAVVLHGNRPYLECKIRFDNAEYTHIEYSDTGNLTLYQSIPANTSISESYLVDLGWVNKLEDRLVTPAVREPHLAAYQADFELFADTVDELAQQYGMVLECTADPDLRSDWHGGLEGLFRVKFVSAEGPYSPYYDNGYRRISSKAVPNIDGLSASSFSYWYWHPGVTSQDVKSAAVASVDNYHALIDSLNAYIDKAVTNTDRLDSYKDICTDIAAQLSKQFAGLSVRPWLSDNRWIVANAPRAEFSVYYGGESLNNLKIADVFQADISKLIRNMQRRLQKVDQRRAEEESSGFTYL